MARLGDIATLITKGTTPTSIGFNFQKEGINFIKIESVDDKGCFIYDKFDHISDECHEKEEMLKKVILPALVQRGFTSYTLSVQT